MPSHEERAKQLKWKRCPHDPNTGSLSASMCDTCLAEQFREVERECDKRYGEWVEAREKENERSFRAACARVEQGERELESKLREVARAGDALREASDDVADGAACTFSDPRVSYEEYQLEPGSIEKLRAALDAWDAATKGIER